MNTSLAAQQSVNVTALEDMVYQAILSTGVRGAISDELRHMFPTLAYSSVTARFFNLEKQGRIYRPGITRRGDSGRAQMVMWADKYQQQVSDRLRKVLGL